MPGKWLVWHAGGLLGPRRYACPDHRKALLKNIRFHYAYCGEQWVWKRPPYAQRWPPDGIPDDPEAPLTIPDWFVPGTDGRARPPPRIPTRLSPEPRRPRPGRPVSSSARPGSWFLTPCRRAPR